MAFVIRTEEINQEDIKRLYVPTDADNEVLDKLKSLTPTVLVGSRGVGKSFLLRVAQQQLEEDSERKIIPVFVTFRNVVTLQTGNKNQFQEYMLSRICSTLLRTLKKRGYFPFNSWSFSGLQEEDFDEKGWPKKLEQVNKRFEDSWRRPGTIIDTTELPTVDDLLELVEDICSETDIERFIVIIDEAAHVFIPEQQIQFFSLFRELRSPFIKCNASVYPGVTFFGKTFDKAHDADFVYMSRNILDENYVFNMKEMVFRQIEDEGIRKMLEVNGANFTALTYSACGNPRILLRSIEKAGKLSNENVNKTIKEFYREEIWEEHSELVVKYPKRQKYIDWGRKFIEEVVLPELKNKNDRLLEKGESTIYFWIDRSAPQAVKEALRILEYTGIVRQHNAGVKATGSVIGIRYEVNMGCLLSQETSPAASCLDIISKLTVRKLSEYGANSKYFEEIKEIDPTEDMMGASEELSILLDKSIDILQLTMWQKDRLKSININTIHDLLLAEESDLRTIHYVGEFKSRQMKNVAMAAVFEYLF